MLMEYSNLTSIFPEKENIAEAATDAFLAKSEYFSEVESTENNHVLRQCRYTGYFMQELFIKTVQETFFKGYIYDQEKLTIFGNIFGDIFFGYTISNENCPGFFIHPESGDTVLTVLSQLDFSASIVDRLLEQAYQKLDLVLTNSTNISRFLAFFSHKNNLGETALSIAIVKKNKELTALLLIRIEKLVASIQKDKLFSLFFDWAPLQYLPKTGAGCFTLLNLSVLMSSTEILEIVIDTVIRIYGVESDLFPNFITANESLLSPLLLAFLSDGFDKFKYLVETAVIAYSKKPLLLFDYIAQGDSLERSVFNQPSLLSLIVNWPSNTTAFIHLLLGTAQHNFSSSKSLFFDYLSFKNTQGKSTLHLALEDSVDNCRFFLDELSNLTERQSFLALLNQRDYYGLTPLLTAWRDQKKSLSLLLQEHGARPYVRPYEWMNGNYQFHVSLKNSIDVSIYHWEKISFDGLIEKKITDSPPIFIRNFISSSTPLFSALEAYKESIFYLTVFILKHPILQNLIHLVYEIRDKENKNKPLNSKERQTIYYYQKIIDSFYHFLKTGDFPFFFPFKGISDGFSGYFFMESDRLEYWERLFFDSNRYLAVHRVDSDFILVDKKPGNRIAIFSGNLFGPLESISLDEKNFSAKFFLLWLKKYFFSECLSQKYVIYTFNETIFYNYTHQLDTLILNTAIMAPIIFEEKNDSLSRTLIQDFFLLNKKFISTINFNVKDFFSLYQSKLTFRSERIESHFFKLSYEEKRALQKILKDYPISHESYDFVFSNLLNKGHDLSLQKNFLKLYGERIVEKIRTFSDIDRLSFHDIFEISFKTYLEIMNIEWTNVKDNPDYFLHMFQTVRTSFDQIARLKKRSFSSALGQFFQFMGTAAIAPFISSLPYIIRAISKISRVYDAFDEILSATAPWLDFLIHKVFDNVYRLPPGIARHLINYIEKCDTCSALGGRIAKNFPLFSFFILLKSLKELMTDCQNDKKGIINFYCVNMIINQILSVVLVGVEIHYADHIRYVFPHYLSAVFLLTGHSVAFETYRHYSKIYDKWNLSIHPLESKLLVYFGLAVGIYSPSDPNYATLGISAPQQVFAAFENFVDFQRDERKVYIYRAAIIVPHVSIVEGRRLPLKENRQGINSTNVFKIDKLANFEFIFGINQTFCHDASVITITPDHKKEFEKEYRIALGTFTGFPDQETGICTRGKKITSDSLAKADDPSSASILANNLFLENGQAHEKLHFLSKRVLFALADPAAVANYSLHFTDEYQEEFDFIALMLKRLLVLESPDTENNIARFTISGLKSADTGKFKTIVYVIASVFWVKTEIIIQAIEAISLMQEFHFHRLEGKYTFYFDGESLATKKGFTIINLQKSKKIAFNMGEHLLSTENKVITVPCGKTFHALRLEGVSREERASLGRLDCGQNHTDYFSVRFGRHTRFLYNETLQITIDTSNDKVSPILYVRIRESAFEHQLQLDSRSVVFSTMQAIPSQNNLLLEFRMDQNEESAAIGSIDLRLAMNTQSHPTNFEETIVGFWSLQNNHTIVKLHVSKQKNQAWESDLFIEEQYAGLSKRQFGLETFATRGYDSVHLARGRETYIAHYFFYKKKKLPKVKGAFKQYKIFKNRAEDIILHLTKENSPEETYVVLAIDCDQIIIDDVRYFISTDVAKLLAIQFEKPDRSHHLLLAPLRIPMSLKDYLKVNQDDQFPIRRVVYLQFDDELVSVQYLKYHRFYAGSLPLLSMKNFQGQAHLLLNGAQVVPMPSIPVVKERSHSFNWNTIAMQLVGGMIGGAGLLSTIVFCYRRVMMRRAPLPINLPEVGPLLLAMNPLPVAGKDLLRLPAVREPLRQILKIDAMLIRFFDDLNTQIVFYINHLNDKRKGSPLIVKPADDNKGDKSANSSSLTAIEISPFHFFKVRCVSSSAKKGDKGALSVTAKPDFFDAKPPGEAMNRHSNALDTDGLLLLGYLGTAYCKGFRAKKRACFFSREVEWIKKMDPTALQVIDHEQAFTERFEDKRLFCTK